MNDTNALDGSNNRPAFRFRKAFLHAFVIHLALVVLSGLVGAFTATDPELTADAVTWLTLPSVVIGFGASFLVQKVWPPLGFGLAAVWVLALPSLLLWAWNGRRVQESEKVPLVQDGQRLRHPTLGFSFDDPGPAFTPMDVAELEGYVALPASHLWAFVNDSVGQTLFVALASAGGAMDSTFIADFGRGLKRSMESSGLQVALESLTLSPERRYDLQSRLWESPAALASCRANGPEARRGLLVCIMVIGPGVVEFAPMLDGLQIGDP